MKTFLMMLVIFMLLLVVACFWRWQGRKRQNANRHPIGGRPCLDSEKSGVPSEQPLSQTETKAEEHAQLVRQLVEAARPPQAVPTTAKASPTARVMAVQLCGERKVAASRSLLERLADDPNENAVVRKSAFHALRAVEER